MSMLGLYLLFIKYGLLCFGGGYVLVPLLLSDFVNHRALMGAEEFARLVAVSQATPGPIGINVATYVGYKLFGLTGAFVGTLGIITPALLLVLLAMAFIKKYEKSLFVSGALSGLRPAAYGLILVAIIVFAELSIFTDKLPIEYLRSLIVGESCEWSFGVRIIPLIIAIATIVLQQKSKISFIWLLVASGVIGALFC